MSQLEQPDAQTVVRRPRRALSKIAGAGAGTALVLWAKKLGFSDGVTGFLEASGPAVAVALSWIGPYFTWFTVHNVQYMGCCFFLRRAKKHLSQMSPGSNSYELALQNVETIETMISRIISDGAGKITDFRW